LAEGKNIDLLAKGTVNVTEKELASPQLQSLVASKDVVIMSGAAPKPDKTETKAVPKDENPPDASAKKTSSTK
jgi:hypothetical protein